MAGLIRAASSLETGLWGMGALVLLLALAAAVSLLAPVEWLRRGLRGQILGGSLAVGTVLALLARGLLWPVGLVILLGGVAWTARCLRAGGRSDLQWVIPASSLAGVGVLLSEISLGEREPVFEPMLVLAAAGALAWGALRYARVPGRFGLWVLAAALASAGWLGLFGGLPVILLGWAMLAGALLLVSLQSLPEPAHAAIPAAWSVLAGLGAARVLGTTTGDWQPVWVLLTVGALLGGWSVVEAFNDASLRPGDAEEGQSRLSPSAPDLYAYGGAFVLTWAALFGMPRSALDQSATLVGLVGIVLIGLLRRMTALTVWGALCLCVSLVTFLTNYTTILVVILALVVSGLAVWRLRRLG